MPLDLFRRHQRKLLTVLAIFSMVAFTLDFSLFRGGGASTGEDPVVFTIYGEPIRRSDTAGLKLERTRANLFMQNLGAGEHFFGGTSDEEMQDAMILDHEADRLQMPRSPELAKLWLRDATQGQLTPELFDQIYRQNFSGEPPFAVTDEQLLGDIANQVRLLKLRSLPVLPVSSPLEMDLSGVTPLDLFQAYRDQNERVSAQFVTFPVEEFVEEVGEPKPRALEAFYQKYADQLPDPDRDTPGFKMPRRVQVEYIVIDQRKTELKLEENLSESEVREYYQDNPDQFPAPDRELPENLFAGDTENELTPIVGDPFLEVREAVRTRLALEKARDETDRVFEAVHEAVLDPFADRYLEVIEANDLALEENQPVTDLPTPFAKDGRTLLAEYAAEHGLRYEITPLLTVEEAGQRFPIASATVGPSWPNNGPNFDEFLFEPRSAVYEPFELADSAGERFLAWKLADEEPYTPKLDEIRDQVVQAWKLEQARPLAEKAARALAKAAREAEGGLKEAADDKRPVLTTSSLPKLSPSLDELAALGLGAGARPSTIPEIPNPGQALRDILFDLQPGQVVVEPNGPKSVYYVLALQDRTTAELSNLFGPIGVRSRLEREVAIEAMRDRVQRWMNYLRSRAGVPPEELDASPVDALATR